MSETEETVVRGAAGMPEPAAERGKPSMAATSPNQSPAATSRNVTWRPDAE